MTTNPTTDRDAIPYPPNNLMNLLLGVLPPGDAARLTKHILDSPWLAAHDAAVTANALAPIKAALDQTEGSGVHVVRGMVRAAFDPAAVEAHEQRIRAEGAQRALDAEVQWFTASHDNVKAQNAYRLAYIDGFAAALGWLRFHAEHPDLPHRADALGQPDPAEAERQEEA